MLRIVESGGRPTRREFLRIGGLSLGGLALSDLLAGASQAGESHMVRDKSVVLLFLQGGPPQIETFDPKLDAPNAEVRSVTGAVNTKLPGVQFGGTLPKMAAMADRMAVVRNFGAGKGGLSHENGYTRLLTGGKQELSDPPIGSMYARVAGSLHRSTGVPTNTLLLPEAIDPDIKLGNPSGAFTFNQTKNYFATPGNLGGEYEPFDPSGGAQLLQNMSLNLPRERFDDRKSLLAQLDTLRRRVDQSGTLQASAAFRQQAYDVLMQGISKAFDLRKEDPRTVAKYDTSQMVPMQQIRRGGSLYWNNLTAPRICSASKCCWLGDSAKRVVGSSRWSIAAGTFTTMATTRPSISA